MLGANIEGAHYSQNQAGDKFLIGRDFRGNHPPSPKDFKQKIAKRNEGLGRPSTETSVSFACSACPPWWAKAFGVAFCELVPSQGGRLPTKHPAFAYYGGQARNHAKQTVRDHKSESL